MTALEIVRAALTAHIAATLPTEPAALLQGLLLGGGSGLSMETWQAFQRAGLLHVIAVSGTNVALVISAIDRLLFWLPRRWRLAPAIALIALYTLLTGASASAVRAGIMGALSLLALHMSRPVDRRRLIALAFLIMMIVRPAWIFDAGFQLSFLAVMGIAEIGSLIEPNLRCLPKTLAVREAVLMTLCAQLSAAPWGSYLFGGYALIAPVANVLIAPIIPLAMLLGSIGVAASMVSPLLGGIVLLPASATLQWMIDVAHTLGSIPLASIPAHPPLWLIILYYCVLIACVRRLAPQSSKRDVGPMHTPAPSSRGIRLEF
jgi:competence protein ComEC